MGHTRTHITILAMALLAMMLAGCVRTESDDVEPAGQPDPTPEAAETADVEPDPTSEPEPTTEPEPTATPDSGDSDNGDWYDLLTTDKTFPDEQIGETVLELAEDEETFLELWEWFQLDESDRPQIDWDSRMVLFAGTGESSSCPMELSSINFDDEERFIAIGIARDDADLMCTADWTPRVYVIAFDREHIGEGELRGLLYDADFDEEIAPEDGTIIREG